MSLTRVTCFFLFLWPFAMIGQLDGLTNYAQEQGLNAAFTYRITQDQKGFIWIGSDNGLFRFDGVQFRHYDRSDGLLNIDVLLAVPLAGDQLFVEAFRNDFFVIDKGRVRTAKDIPGLAGIPLPVVGTHHLIATREGKTALLVDKMDAKEAFRYEDGKVRSVRFRFPAGFTKGRYDVITFPGSDTVVFVSKQQRVNSWTADCVTGKVSYYGEWKRLPTNSQGIDRYRVASFHRRELWLQDRRQPGAYASHTFSTEVMATWSTGRYLWAALATGGVAVFDRETDPELKVPRFLLNDYLVQHALLDADGNAWFSTRNNGIFFLPARSFRSFLSGATKRDQRGVSVMASFSDLYFTGFSDGMFSTTKNGAVGFGSAGENKYEVRGIWGDERYLIIGKSQGCYRVDRQTGATKEVQPLENNSSAIKNIVPYGTDHVLICSGRCIVGYDYVRDKADFRINQNAYCATWLDKNRLLVGDFRDIYLHDRTTGKKSLFLSGYYISDIQRISDNRFVCASNGYGVVFFDRNRNVHRVTTRDGLPSDQVRRVRIEREGVYWACTTSGLCRIEKAGNRYNVRVFTRCDGLPSDRVSDCVILRDTVFAGTASGLAPLSMKSLLGQSAFIDKKVIVNSVTAGDTFLSMPKEVVTEYPANTVAFNFSFLDYLSNGKIGYRYRIEGLDAKWQETTSSRIILNALPPGHYRLGVYGLGYNGKRSKEATIIPIEIKPRFWQTWWFYLLCSAVAFGLLLTLVLYLLRKRRDKRLRELLYSQKVAELELQAVKAQMNPHFVYNCLNSIQYLLLKEDYPNTERYLGAFSRLIRATLHYSDNTFLSVREEIDYLELYLGMEKLRFRERFSYRIRCGEGVNAEAKVPSMLVQPFVENALKHGIGALPDDQPGRLEVLFDQLENELCIMVVDNGPGLSREDLEKPSSFGLRIAGKRIETYRQLFGTRIRMEVCDRRTEGSSGLEIRLFIATT